MKVEPYKLSSFSGSSTVLAYRQTPKEVSVILNRVNFVGTKTYTRHDFERQYMPKNVGEDGIQKTLEGLKLYALTVGMTAEAAEVLPKLIHMTKEEIQMATEKGSVIEGRILDDAQAEFDKDVKAGKEPKAKAPRKLAGAALKAVLAKQEREAAAKAAKTEEAAAAAPVKRVKAAKTGGSKPITPDEVQAAEAKVLAAAVSEELTAQEAAGAEDVTLTKVKGAKSSAKKPADTTPTKREAQRILNGTTDPKKVADKKAEGFDVASLKTSEGKWKSASAMFKGLIYEGKIKDDAKLFAAVQKEFDLSDDKIGYVSWNRGWFRRQGITLPS